MQNVRLRRLKADYEALRRLAHIHPKIEIEGVSGNPPDRYRIVLRVASLRERGDSIEKAHEHRLEVTMPSGYPRDAPVFRMLTPVFHPNIAPHAVCIGDDWTAGESIDLLIQRVGEILAYQSYNTKSPLNGRAAAWVEEHRAEMPVDREEFFLDLANTAAITRDALACSNCGATSPLTACSTGHKLCDDCVIRCATCARVTCLTCGEKTCPACAVSTKSVCANCGAGSVRAACDQGHMLCEDCVIKCATCERVTCLTCGEKACPDCAPA